MASTLNQATIIGHLGRDPELRYSQSGMPMCRMSVATSERIRGQDGQPTDHTEWHRIISFDKIAESCSRYLHKGSLVYITGRIRSRKYTDSDNVEKYTTEIIANQILFLDRKEDRASTSGYEDYNYNQPPQDTSQQQHPQQEYNGQQDRYGYAPQQPQDRDALARVSNNAQAYGNTPF